MAVRTAWYNNIPYAFDRATGEWVWRLAPVQFTDDFIGNAFDATSKWEVVNSNLAADPGLVDDATNGVAEITLSNDNDAEQGVIYQNDNLQFQLDNKLHFQCRISPHVLPTLTGEMVMGVASATSAVDFDTIATSAWFKLDGSGAVVVETDDTTTNNDDKATGVTLVADEWAVLRIDATDLTSVKFYINGSRVASTTTFDMSKATGATGKVQPYFGVQNGVGGADAAVGTLYIDSVAIWQDERS